MRGGCVGSLFLLEKGNVTNIQLFIGLKLTNYEI